MPTLVTPTRIPPRTWTLKYITPHLTWPPGWQVNRHHTLDMSKTLFLPSPLPTAWSMVPAAQIRSLGHPWGGPFPPIRNPLGCPVDFTFWMYSKHILPMSTVSTFAQATFSLTWSSATAVYQLPLCPHLPLQSMLHTMADGVLNRNVSPTNITPAGTPTTLGILNKPLTWPQGPALPTAITHFPLTHHAPDFSQVLSEAKCFVLRALTPTFWFFPPHFHMVTSLVTFKFPLKWKLQGTFVDHSIDTGPLRHSWRQSFVSFAVLPQLYFSRLFSVHLSLLVYPKGQRSHVSRSLLHS